MIISCNTIKYQEYLRIYRFESFLQREILRKLQLCSFRDGEYLCREGEPCDYLYFLVDGRCKVTRFLNNGKEALICFYHDFAVLGEIELIQSFRMIGQQTPEQKSVTRTNVKAIGPVWCMRLPLAATQGVIMESPPFLRFLCEHLSQKMIRSNRNMSISLNYPVDERLASYICCSCQEGIFQENHTHLAEYLGCSHRQLLRVLHQFCEEGLLKKERHFYRIADEERLRKLAGDIYSP